MFKVSARAEKILIVEDEALTALNIETLLRELGYEVTGVSRSAEDALRRVSENTPTLVLMDIRISGEVDGIETARRILENHDIAVVFLTAASDVETMERAKQVGPFGYLVKPFHPLSLAVAIDIALNRHRTEKELRQQREWFSNVLRNMSEGVIVTDDAGKVVFMNPVAEKLTGWRLSEAVNRPSHTVLQLRDPASGAKLDDLVPTALDYGKSIAIPSGFVAISRRKERFAVEGYIAPNPEGLLFSGAIITFRDPSERLYEEEEVMEVGFMTAEAEKQQ